MCFDFIKMKIEMDGLDGAVPHYSPIHSTNMRSNIFFVLFCFYAKNLSISAERNVKVK